MTDFKRTQYKLRLAVGVLGMLLPIFLLSGHGMHFLSSMSHYYYTASSIFFVGVISSFSVALYSYQGYPKTATEKWSDNQVTTLAAVFAVIMVLVPTESSGSIGVLDFYEQPYLFGYQHDQIFNTVHLLCAAFFIGLLGYMSYAKFTLDPDLTTRKKRFYETCGILVWVSIGMIALFKVLELITPIKDFNKVVPYYIFWLECTAIWAFGIAWLVKAKPAKLYGKTKDNIVDNL